MARDYRKVSEAHGHVLVAHSVLSSASAAPFEEMCVRIGAAMAILDFALASLGTPGTVAREKAAEVASYPSIKALQPELPFEA